MPTRHKTFATKIDYLTPTDRIRVDCPPDLDDNLLVIRHNSGRYTVEGSEPYPVAPLNGEDTKAYQVDFSHAIPCTAFEIYQPFLMTQFITHMRALTGLAPASELVDNYIYYEPLDVSPHRPARLRASFKGMDVIPFFFDDRSGRPVILAFDGDQTILSRRTLTVNAFMVFVDTLLDQRRFVDRYNLVEQTREGTTYLLHYNLNQYIRKPYS